MQTFAEVLISWKPLLGQPAGEFMSPSHLATVVKTALIGRDLIKGLFCASSRTSSKIDMKILEMIKYFTL